MQARNFLLFIALTILILFAWAKVEPRLFPPKPKTEEKEVKHDDEPPVKPADEVAAAAAVAAGKSAVRASTEPTGVQAAALAAGAAAADSARKSLRAVARRLTPPAELVTLGSGAPNSKYHLGVVLDPKGAGVQRVLLNKFKAGDDWGRPTENLLELVPGPKPNELVRDGSFHLYLYGDPSDEFPRDTLGNVKWDRVAENTEKLPDGRERQSVSFNTATSGASITKTFSLTEGEYHLGLEVRIKRTAVGENTMKIRYQLAGAHGLPVEGRWYTSIFRNALIATVDKNSVLRDIQDLRQISVWGGGKPIGKEKNHILRYAGIAVQYFASVIVVDDEQEMQDFLARARPTLEVYVVKGRIKSVGERGLSFVLETDDQKEETFYPAEDGNLLNGVEKGQRFAVVASTDGRGRAIAHELADHDSTQPLWRDDITVRVTTEPIELRKVNDDVVHKYLLYNGPVKPSLLGMPGHESVAPEVIERYVDKLKLNTLTDYQSPGFFGTVSSTIYWTDIIIKCTNVMHWVLSQINRLIPNYGVCIICLTILVRGLMFPVSRKQALMSLKMQELAPEMKKLQEKHKGDRQAIGVATMELYRKHGVNPFGTCWFILLQMPIFMGLYFALQESTYFRLAPAWPSWIANLAAPDMLVRWGEGIPWLSRPQDYGGFLYLGPYLNLLPLIAVTLMIFQQKMMTPPPQDEQQEMQQKVMKYMMVFFGLLFYKVAAGLCLYFIASSVWGFAERRLLPRKKLHDRSLALEEVPAGAVVASPSGAAMTIGNRGRKQGRMKKNSESDRTTEEIGNGSAWSRFRQRIRAWWDDVLKNAEKK